MVESSTVLSTRGTIDEGGANGYIRSEYFSPVPGSFTMSTWAKASPLFTDGQELVYFGEAHTNYKIAEITQHVATPLRGGTVVSFEVEKLQAFVGQLFVLAEGKRTPAEYWGLELELPDGKTQAIVGRNAEFYLENIPTGEWPTRLFLQDEECLFVMTIPQSEEMIVEMGEITCEID